VLILIGTNTSVIHFTLTEIAKIINRNKTTVRGLLSRLNCYILPKGKGRVYDIKKVLEIPATEDNDDNKNKNQEQKSLPHTVC
jgi:hypothetical protein